MTADTKVIIDIAASLNIVLKYPNTDIFRAFCFSFLSSSSVFDVATARLFIIL